MALPIDTARMTTVLAHDQAAAVAEYGQADASGNRARIEGGQGRDKLTGLPLWTVHVLFMVAGAPPELAKVKVAAPVAPVLDGVAPFTPVNLVNLTATPWIDGRKVSISYRAEGVDVLVAQGRKADAA